MSELQNYRFCLEQGKAPGLWSTPFSWARGFIWIWLRRVLPGTTANAGCAFWSYMGTRGTSHRPHFFHFLTDNPGERKRFFTSFFKGSPSFHAEGCWARGCLWLASRKETCLLFNKGLRAHCSAVPPGAHTERQNCALTFQPLELPFISSPRPANGCSYTQVHHKKQSWTLGSSCSLVREN